MTAKPITRYCDECQHLQEHYGRPVEHSCAKGHALRFYHAQTLSQAHRGDWGFKRRCADFQAKTVP